MFRHCLDKLPYPGRLLLAGILQRSQQGKGYLAFLQVGAHRLAERLPVRIVQHVILDLECRPGERGEPVEQGKHFPVCAAEERPQMHICATVGADDEEKGYLAYARVYLDKVDILAPPGTTGNVASYDIGTTKFHTFVLEADAKTKTAKLFVDGAAEPILTVPMPQAMAGPSISIGDGSGSIFGAADVSYFAWTVK